MRERVGATGPCCLTALMAGAALAFLPATACAAEACNASADQEGVFSLVVENDSLSSGADRNYTSGVEAGYVAPNNCRIPQTLDNAARPFTQLFSKADPAFWGVAIGQSIFTPEDIQADPAPPDQHPYAGWLYVQFAVAAEIKPSAVHPIGYLDTYEFQLGVVGPWALGEQAQDSIHKLLGAPGARGWESQLHNELAFAASFDRRWNWGAHPLPVFSALDYDVTPTLGFTVGTLRDEARAGLIARVGTALNGDYGPPRVRPSLAGVEQFANEPLSWSLFAGVEGRAVAHDLFLDGNTFRDSARVAREPYVADYQAGFSFSSGEWRMTYTYVWRTNEFKTQAGRQDFGSLSLSRRF
ncbi:MAG: lipid A deacylase LpxR family protein [Terricaulis sp.]